MIRIAEGPVRDALPSDASSPIDRALLLSFQTNETKESFLLESAVSLTESDEVGSCTGRRVSFGRRVAACGLVGDRLASTFASDAFR